MLLSFDLRKLSAAKKRVFRFTVFSSALWFALFCAGCRKGADPTSEAAQGFDEYVLVIGTELRHMDVGNLVRSLQLAKGDINGDFVVFVNGDPIARVVDFCGLTVARFLREGDNVLCLKGSAPQQFKVGLSVSRKVSGLKHAYEDVFIEEIKPVEANIIDVTIPFSVERPAKNPDFAVAIPEDHESVEAELKDWLEGVNELIRSKKYEEIYNTVFAYRHEWNAANYGRPVELERESWAEQTAQSGFRMFPVDLENVRFIYGEHLILAYDATVHSDGLNVQGVIMMDSGAGSQHSLVDYLRFVKIDNNWKVW